VAYDASSSRRRLAPWLRRPYHAVRTRTLLIGRNARLRGNRARGVVCCWPDLPRPETAIWKYTALIGLQLRRARPDSGTLVLWQDTTQIDSTIAEALRRQPGRDVLNGACLDISKRFVDARHLDVFGYALAVDPLIHEGPMVAKSDANAVHDGMIIEGPCTPTPGRVYQRVIDNVEGDFVIDLRVPVVGDEIPFVYRKWRPLATRFANTNTRCDVVDRAAEFDADECAGLVRFAATVGLDIGELDVLRDRGDGRLYVVDVNKTPYGPPNGLGDADGAGAMQSLAEAFERRLLRPRGD
jgi:hypothetical protein